MISDTTHHTPRIEAYVREDLRGAVDRIDDVLDRLERLSEEGEIESFSVESWESPTRSLSEDASARPRTAVRETVDEFEDWAARHGYTLSPAVDRSEDAEEVEVPIVCLAVYDADDELLAVYPHTVSQEGVRTVEDGLSALSRSQER